METSAFLFENLPYSLLLWLHFGTGILISYSYLFYVIPILYNIIIIALPYFNFGFTKGKDSSSKSTIIPADLNKTLRDSKIFAYAYSRNPKLFSSLPIEEIGTFFNNLDEKLSNISSALKDFPVSKEDKKAEQSSEVKSSEGYETSSENINRDFDGNIEDTVPDTKKGKIKKKKEGKEKSSKSSIRNLLIYGNLFFLIAILGVNVYGYYQTNSLFNNYFVLKKGRFKYSSKIYKLNNKKVRMVKNSDKIQMLFDMNNYIEMINSAKTEKNRRQKIKEEKEKKNLNK